MRKFEQVSVKILDQNGNVITKTPDFEEISKALFEGIRTSDINDPSKAVERRETETGKVYKVKIIRIQTSTPNPQERVIQIALDRTHEETFLASYRSWLITVLCIALFITAFIGRRIAVKGIRPVSEIAETVKKIRSTNLHERINATNVPEELLILAKTFNEMLDRLTESFDRLSRFSQDIAHDLRTPLNNLRGELEVALGRARTPEEYQEVLGSCLEECARLSHLIDNLLFLTRADNPRTQLAIESLNVRNEISQLTDFFEASATEAGIKLQIDISSDLQIQADRALFQRALGNLITNAVYYTKREGLIAISAEALEKVVVIEVHDTGVGICSEHLPKIFDRFYRVDESRSAHSGGSGLGLPIVKGIMNLHRGDIEISSEIGIGTKARLIFPFN